MVKNKLTEPNLDIKKDLTLKSNFFKSNEPIKESVITLKTVNTGSFSNNPNNKTLKMLNETG